MKGEELPLFVDQPGVKEVIDAVRKILNLHAQPSAWELLDDLDSRLGLKVRWTVTEAMRVLADDRSLTKSQREYLRDLLFSEDWRNALRGTEKPGREVSSTIDELLRDSAVYRNSETFEEMVSFMANFREYAPFNNMLVRIQNPSCSFYPTERDWEKRFKRCLKEDAHPMLILAPMHPVMLVYDLDQTKGPPLPKELQEFAKFAGEWDPQQLDRTIENAWERDKIRIELKRLSSTNAGFATLTRGRGEGKMRIAIHEELNPPSRYGVLCHELAHIYLGHLGSDKDGWWPSRVDLNHWAMEVEAEAAAYITTRRAELSGSSPQYVSRYLNNDTVLKSVSVDLIAKVAGRLEKMATRRMPQRRIRNGNP